MTIINFYILVFLFALFNAGVAQAQAQHKVSPVDRTDCSKISVDYRNNPNLTQQEKIELMDKALFHSLDKYEGCQSIRASAAAGGGGAGGSQSGASQLSEGGAKGNGGSRASTASSQMSGTQTTAAQNTSSDRLNDSMDNKTALDAAPMKTNANKRHQNVQLKGSGKVPDDIPPVDNDSILEAQIRQAAMNESDPIIKAKLWNEYRKYKGLPAQQGSMQ